MDFTNEFTKIKDSFLRVKEDITFLSNKVYENYDEFMQHHLKLVKEVKEITEHLKNQSKEFIESNKKKLDDKGILNLKQDIKDVRKIIKSILAKYKALEKALSDIKENKKDIKELKKTTKNSQLEIYLLKERLIKKDDELKQIKEINRHMFNTLDELTKLELEMLNKI